MRLFVLDADYTIEESKPVIRLFCRSEDGKSVVVYDRTFEPYFYAIAKKGAKSAKKKVSQVFVSDEKGVASVKRVENIEKIIGLKEKKIFKVFAKLPFDVPKLKDAVAALPEIEGVREFDIPFFKKYLIDKKILPLSWADVTGDKTESSLSVDTALDAKNVSAADSTEYNPSLFAFDLETIAEEGTNKIIMASVCTDAGYKKVIVYEKDNFSESIHVDSEKAVIEKLCALVKEKDPDLVLTYNGDSFDFDVLKNRAEEYGTVVNFGRDGQGVKYQRKGRINAASIRGRVHIDLFQFVSRIMRPTISSEVMSLDNVSGELTGSRKKDMTWETMIDSWQNKKDLDKLAEYCLNDSEITVGLAKALLPNIVALSKLTGSTPFDTCRATYGQLVEAYALRRASELNIAVPNKPTQDVVRERMEMDKFQGAFVVEPKPGLHKNIALFDFRSLYPSIIASHNIEPDTLNCTCCKSKKENQVPGTSSYFCTKQRGFIPRLVEELISERIEMKKRMKVVDKKSDEYKSLNAKQFAVKTLANSFYGYLGFAGSRWYLRECAEAVTAFGRHYIHKVIEMAEKRGLKCIYGDSITSERFVTVMNKEGIVHIKNIEELFLEFMKKKQAVGEKETVIPNDYRALTLNQETGKAEWREINELIRHKTSKKIFRVGQKYGETIVTEDHSLMAEQDGIISEIKPQDMAGKKMVPVRDVPEIKQLCSIDFYKILSDYSNKTIYKKRQKVSSIRKSGEWLIFGWTNRKSPVKLKRTIRTNSKMFEALCRLLGAYIAEGSSSTAETTKTKFGASISSSDVKWLEQLQEDYLLLFKNAKTGIIKSTQKKRTLCYKSGTGEKTIEYEDKTHKLQMMNQLSAVFFKMLCGQKSHAKKMPEFIYSVPEKYQRILLENMILGDGSRKFMNRRLHYSKHYKENNFRYETRSLQLMGGLSFLLNMLKQKYTIRFRPDKNTYILTTTSKNNSCTPTKVIEEKYGGYVYDLSVEGTHTFVDSCGQILLHNTDSLFLLIEKDTEAVARKFLKDVNSTLPGIMELDYEGTYLRGIFVQKKTGEGGAKKRYALIDKEGNVTIRGFEKVRRDWSKLAKDTQERVLELVLSDKKDDAVEYVKTIVEKVKSGKVDLKELGIYTTVKRDLNKYRQIGPHVSAAKRAEKRGVTIHPGTTIQYVVTRGSGSISERAELMQFAKNYDKAYYLENQILPAALRALSVLGVTKDDLLGNAKQTGLGKWGNAT